MDLSLILEVDDLTVGSATPGAAPILDHISFRLNTSEIFGIYGESGAGKTVLSRALANWLPQSLAYRSGGVTFAGQDILGAGAREVRIGRDIACIGS
uniref:ATP-binding cassette domain-containing protein n=3 Tax=Nitrobacteraceae TaxID=41294 RepID=UPI00056EAD52